MCKDMYLFNLSSVELVHRHKVNKLVSLYKIVAYIIQILFIQTLSGTIKISPPQNPTTPKQ